ncbi:permease [candidate division KSB1 bacterium]|nr:permease [candidate division KSB1 bacterium]
MKRNHVIYALFIGVFFIFLFYSHQTEFSPGMQIQQHFIIFMLQMLKVLPCAFIIIGLFDVWVKKETIQKHFSGIRGYAYAILLAGTTVGGLYVAFPLACSLYKKGASLQLIFFYLFAAGIFRIPMTVFESSFVGVKFTIIRLLISLPLILIFSVALGTYLDNKGFRFEECS